MKVWLESEIDNFTIEIESHRRFAELLLEISGEVDAELSIQLVNDDRMCELNSHYRGINQPTDVLSFSMREGDFIGQQAMLGDIVISVETASKQAANYGNTLEEELDELIFHGFLHLLGYDHEQNPKKWQDEENRLRSSLQHRKISYIPKGMQPADRKTQ